MTKVRPPVTIENTLYRILGELGIDKAAEVTGRSQDYLRALSDHDKREQLTVRDMISLDAACRANGDPTYPLYETVGLILLASGAEDLSNAACLGHSVVALAREHGEAQSALIDAVIHPGDIIRMETALREAEESRDAQTDTIALLSTQLNRARGAQCT